MENRVNDLLEKLAIKYIDDVDTLKIVEEIAATIALERINREMKGG